MKRFISFAGLLGILMMMSTLAFAYDKGDRVLALWEDAYWYPGTVVAVDGNVLTIEFDDWQAGDIVECRWPYNNKNYPGRFTKVNGENVRIVFDDGDKAELTVRVCRQSRASRLVGR